MGIRWKQWLTLFWGAPKALQMVTAAIKAKGTCCWKKSVTNLDSMLKKQRPHFADKGPYSQNYVFSSSHIQMWELEHKEGWTLKNLCFQTVVLEKSLESPLDCKEIKPINSKGDHPWIFIGRTDAEAEAPVLWPPDVKRTHLKSPWCWERLK